MRRKEWLIPFSNLQHTYRMLLFVWLAVPRSQSNEMENRKCLNRSSVYIRFCFCQRFRTHTWHGNRHKLHIVYYAHSRYTHSLVLQPHVVPIEMDWRRPSLACEKRCAACGHEKLRKSSQFPQSIKISYGKYELYIRYRPRSLPIQQPAASVRRWSLSVCNAKFPALP